MAFQKAYIHMYSVEAEQTFNSRAGLDNLILDGARQ